MQSNNNTYWCYLVYVIWIEMSDGVEKIKTANKFRIHMWKRAVRSLYTASIPICSNDKYAVSFVHRFYLRHTFKCRHFCIKVCLFAVVNDSHSRLTVIQHWEIWMWKMYENRGREEKGKKSTNDGRHRAHYSNITQ